MKVCSKTLSSGLEMTVAKPAVAAPVRFFGDHFYYHSPMEGEKRTYAAHKIVRRPVLTLRLYKRLTSQ